MLELPDYNESDDGGSHQSVQQQTVQRIRVSSVSTRNSVTGSAKQLVSSSASRSLHDDQESMTSFRSRFSRDGSRGSRDSSRQPMARQHMASSMPHLTNQSGEGDSDSRTDDSFQITGSLIEGFGPISSGQMLPRTVEIMHSDFQEAAKKEPSLSLTGVHMDHSHESQSNVRGCWWNETSRAKPKRRIRGNKTLHGNAEQGKAPHGARLVDYAKRRQPMSAMPGFNITGAVRGGAKARFGNKQRPQPNPTSGGAARGSLVPLEASFGDANMGDFLSPESPLWERLQGEQQQQQQQQQQRKQQRTGGANERSGLDTPPNQARTVPLARGVTPAVNHSPARTAGYRRGNATPLGRTGKKLTVFGNLRHEKRFFRGVPSMDASHVDAWQPVSIIFNIRVYDAYVSASQSGGGGGGGGDGGDEPSDAVKTYRLLQRFYIGDVNGEDDSVIASQLIAGALSDSDIGWLRQRLTIRDSVRFNTAIRRQLVQLWNMLSVPPDPTDLDSPFGKLVSPLKYHDETSEEAPVHFGERVLHLEEYVYLHIAARLVSDRLLGTTVAGGDQEGKSLTKSPFPSLAEVALWPDEASITGRAVKDFEADCGMDDRTVNFMRFVVLVLQFADNVIGKPILAHYKLLLSQLIDIAGSDKPVDNIGVIGVIDSAQSIRSTHSDRSSAISVPPLIVDDASSFKGSLAHAGSFDSSKASGPQEMMYPPTVTLGKSSLNASSSDGQLEGVTPLPTVGADGGGAASFTQEQSMTGSALTPTFPLQSLQKSTHSISVMLPPSLSVHGSVDLSEKSSTTLEPFYQRLGNNAAVRSLTRGNIVEYKSSRDHGTLGTPKPWTPEVEFLNALGETAKGEKPPVPKPSPETPQVRQTSDSFESEAAASLLSGSAQPKESPYLPKESPYLPATPPQTIPSRDPDEPQFKTTSAIPKYEFTAFLSGDTAEVPGPSDKKTAEVLNLEGGEQTGEGKPPPGLPHATYAYMDELRPDKYPHRTLSQDPTGDLMKIINCPDIEMVNFEFLRRGIGARKLFKGVPMWAYSDRTSPFETFGLLRPMSCQPTHMYITPKADPDLRPYLKRYIQTFNTLGGRDCFIGDLSDSKKSLARTSDPRHLKKRLSSLVDVSSVLPASCDR